MSDDENPLERLHVDADSIDRELLASALEDVIKIDQETGEARHLQSFSELDNEQKAVARMLYKTAAVDLGHFDEDEVGEGSQTLGDVIGVDGSTVRGYFGDLAFVENDNSRGGYYVPGYALQEAVEFIRLNDEE